MDILKQIEKYLDGSMSSDEKKHFKQAVIEDKKLADELFLHQEINEAILDDDIVNFRRIVKNIEEQPVVKKHFNNSLISAIKIPLAASVLILIVMSLFKIVEYQNPSKLYTNFYEPYITDISTRSIVQSKNKIQLSYSLYQQGDYEASFEILKNYISNNFDDQAAHFYLGLNALELNQFDLAIDVFSLIEQEKHSQIGRAHV